MKDDKKRKHSLSTGDDAQHGSFVLNYTGQLDWGEVAAYIDWYAFIVEGHYTIEVTALADKIIVGFKQLIDILTRISMRLHFTRNSARWAYLAKQMIRTPNNCQSMRCRILQNKQEFSLCEIV